MFDKTKSIIEDLGYVFYPRKNHQDIGYSRLEVALRSHPTEEHFDPEEFRLRVASEIGGIEYLHVNHPWAGEELYRACVGHVLLRDRKNKTISSYTYGGDLRIEANKDQTTCVLASPAPILRMKGDISIPSLTVVETDILLAKIAAESSQMVFEERLPMVDPLMLYGASLVSIDSKFLEFEHKEFSHILNFIQFIRREKEKLQESGELPVPIPELVDIFRFQD
jgi:hypothetical protein